MEERVWRSNSNTPIAATTPTHIHWSVDEQHFFLVKEPVDDLSNGSDVPADEALEGHVDRGDVLLGQRHSLRGRVEPQPVLVPGASCIRR